MGDMNRAYGLLPLVDGAIDMEMGESVYRDYDFDKKTYGKQYIFRLDRPSRMPGDTLFLFQKQPRYPGTDGPHSHNRYFGCLAS